jgi:Flp pilus assembly protein TadG
VKADTAQSEDGQALVEFALIFSVLMGFVFCYMELCMVLYSYDMISESAREGTRYAIVHGSACLTSANASCTATAANVNAYVSGLGWVSPGGTMSVATTYPDGNENLGSRVQVTAKYTFPITLPWVPSESISMQSSSQMYIIQ